jgi:hypothetical protein
MLKLHTVEQTKIRIGSTVTCDYYPGTKFKVTKKEHDINGNLLFSITNSTETYSGVKSKYINK